MKNIIFDYITDIAKKKGKEINPNTDLFEEFILDSLELINLLTFMQEKLNIKFTPDDLQFDNYQTIEKIVNWAQKHSAEKI